MKLSIISEIQYKDTTSYMCRNGNDQQYQVNSVKDTIHDPRNQEFKKRKKRKQQITENAADIGHVVLDVAGLIPGLEIADITNAIWYAKEKKYLSSLLSIISVIPAAGDIAGKGLKLLSSTGVSLPKFVIKYNKFINKHWPEVLKIVKSSKDLQPYADAIETTYNKIITYKNNDRKNHN